MKQSLEHQRRNLNDCRAEITSLKMHIEGSRAGQYVSSSEGDAAQSQSAENVDKQKSSLPLEVEKPTTEKDVGLSSESSISNEKGHTQTEDGLVKEEIKNIIPDQREVAADASSVSYKSLDSTLENQKEVSNHLLSPSNGNYSPSDLESILKLDSGIGRSKSENALVEAAPEETVSPDYIFKVFTLSYFLMILLKDTFVISKIGRATCSCLLSLRYTNAILCLT